MFERQVMLECHACESTIRCEARRVGDAEEWTHCPLCGDERFTVETWGEALPGW